MWSPIRSPVRHSFVLLTSSLRMSSLTDVQRNLDDVRSRVEKAAGGREVRLVAVSKYQPAAAVEECYRHGQRHFGENYVQELEEKANLLQYPDIRWHYIGQIQSNKIPKIGCIPNLFCVETLESEKHCALLEKAMAKEDKRLRVLIQVNTSHEVQKGGLTPDEGISLASFVLRECPHLEFAGLMTIGSIENAGKDPNPDFDVLVDTRWKCAAKLGVDENSLELSMGMSSDMETAIKQGSTSVRVGTSIFGARHAK